MANTYCKVLKLYLWKTEDTLPAEINPDETKTLSVFFNGYKYDIQLVLSSLPTYAPDSTATPLEVTIAITRSFNTPVISWKAHEAAQGIIFPPQRFTYEKWMDYLHIETEIQEAEGAIPDMGSTLETV